MWVLERSFKVPSTKKPFKLITNNHNVHAIKPGKAFVFFKDTVKFHPLRQIMVLSNKVDRIVTSSNGKTALHILKDLPMVAYHDNKPESVLITFPMPKTTYDKKTDSFPSVMDSKAPEGYGLLMTPSQDDIPSNIITNARYRRRGFSDCIQGVSISEGGHGIAIALNNQIWVWQQYPGQVLGVGFWTDLTANQKFIVNVRSNHPETQYANYTQHHGFSKVRQTFTLSPVLAPNIPANAAISYQDLCMFDNPDEGIGVCCLTCVLPPCRPYDTLRLFISICTFKGFEPVFERSELLLPIVEGYGGPCIWWSIDCRVAVIAVSKSLVLVTRHLRVIKNIPLEEVFPGDEPLVASIAWSSSGQYFIATSMNGTISGVTRDGESLRHILCALEPFKDYDDTTPLQVAADAKDPDFFIIYSDKKFRPFKMETSKIERNLITLISLQFPQRTASNYIDEAYEIIRKNGTSTPYDLVKLLYYTDFFRIFPFQSPLRYLLLTLFNDGAKKSLEDGNDIFTLFIIRCVLRLTDYAVDIYQTVLDMLSYSGQVSKRDKLLHAILEDEFYKRDYYKTRERMDPRIMLYEPTEEDHEQLIKATKPPHGREVDLIPLIKFVKDVIYNDDMSDLQSIECDLNLFLNILIRLGLFDRAMKLTKHRSITTEPAQIFQRIIEMHSNDASQLYRALVSCIKAAPEDENELRGLCTKAILDILRERVGSSIPTKGNFISKLVSLEEDIDLFVPETIDHLNDFAVILGIGMCAADYKNCRHFMDHKPNLIHEYIRESVHTLFGILWFVQYRYLAITETAKRGNANNATLRLLAFPDFINIDTALSQIKASPLSEFSNELYTLYVNGSRTFEDDPSFPAFASDCSSKITPRLLSRISTAVLQLGTDDECDIPHSGILVSIIVSHLIPWLRCGIPRALMEFKCEDDVPPELLNFEEFSFQKIPPPKMEIDTQALAEVDPDENIPQKESDTMSYGEAPKRRRRKEPPSFLDSDYSEPPRKKPKRKKPRKLPTRLLTIDPLSAAPPPAPAVPMNQQYYPYQPMYQPVTIPMYYGQPEVFHNYQQPQTNLAFQPIWDFNPADFNRHEEEPPEPPKKETPPRPSHAEVESATIKIPKMTTMETQVDPPKARPIKPMVIVHSTQKQKEELAQIDISSSSELSDIPLIEPIQKTHPNINPFPLDDGLHKKVEMLLDEVRGIPDSPELPEMPQFVPPPIYDYPHPDFRELNEEIIPNRIPQVPPPQQQPIFMQQTTINQFQTEPNPPYHSMRPPPPSNDYRPPLQSKYRIDDQNPPHPTYQWRPGITPMKNSNILGFKEIPIDQFNQSPGTSHKNLPTTTLQEIKEIKK